jgi:uncharacterized protein (DUF952 family)
VTPDSDQIFHLTTRAAWQDAQIDGDYRMSTRGRSLADVGFIHCSTSRQLAGVAAAFYSDCDEDLVILTLSLTQLAAEGLSVRFEDGGNGDQYPHIYGPLPTRLVSIVRPATSTAFGQLDFP